MFRDDNNSQQFPIANYKLLSDLILRLKATGAKQENFVKTDYWLDSSCENSIGVWFNTKDTAFTVRRTTNSFTLYLGDNAICKTTSEKVSKYINSYYRTFEQTITSVINLQPLATPSQPNNSDTEYFYFLTGNDKPSDLQIKHLSYIGIDASSFVRKEDKLWYIRIPIISLFETKTTEEYRHGKYIMLLYCRVEIAGTHINRETPVEYEFYIQTFRLPRLTNNRLVLEQPTEIKKHYLGGYEFTGTIEAFSCALAKKEVYSVFKLESKSADYSDIPFDLEHAELFYQTISHNAGLKGIDISEITVSGEGLIRMLEAIRSLPNLKQLFFSNVTFTSALSVDLMVKIYELFVDIPTHIYCYESRMNEFYERLLNLSSLLELRDQRNSHFSLLPRNIVATVSTYRFFQSRQQIATTAKESPLTAINKP